ncbi:TolC family protein [Ferruginibacter albus]|uniref:TolC family protein n=1 Tax=Ferruginibacter albus TaxID=2875540 RepID=UPI001CC6A9B1|nr:TolC family protein [Ferruginibacter albus]UAY50632.1 TolC family protein [Ferruginibacter albus]
MRKNLILLFTIGIFAYGNTFSQTKNDSLLTDATINSCIQYALTHQPQIQQSLINEKITDETVKIKLADWFPQLNLNYSYQNNIQLQTAYISGGYAQTGTHNVSGLGASVTQNIFNKDLLLANRTAGDVRKEAAQETSNNKINTIAAVSKAYYDVLLTQKQVDVIDEDISRLERSLKDAYNQYQGGIVDKTDYKRATISLNNAKAQRKQIASEVIAKYAYLKQQMGYPDSASLTLYYDTLQIEKDAAADTSALVNYDSRIEYQILQTQRKLYEANIKYYKWSYLPTVSAFGAYNFNYLNNQFSKLYAESFPNSLVGLQLTLPIFQGGKRIYQTRQAEQQLQILDLDIVNLKNNINVQYQSALAEYKGNWASYVSLKDNVALANDVYNVIRLQYQQGIKTYLDVIIAESDLRSAQLNYFTSLYQLLESKIDMQKALGTL